MRMAHLNKNNTGLFSNKAYKINELGGLGFSSMVSVESYLVPTLNKSDTENNSGELRKNFKATRVEKILSWELK
jgi:hypothetical protein